MAYSVPCVSRGYDPYDFTDSESDFSPRSTHLQTGSHDRLSTQSLTSTPQATRHRSAARKQLHVGLGPGLEDPGCSPVRQDSLMPLAQPFPVSSEVDTDSEQVLFPKPSDTSSSSDLHLSLTLPDISLQSSSQISIDHIPADILPLQVRSENGRPAEVKTKRLLRLYREEQHKRQNVEKELEDLRKQFSQLKQQHSACEDTLSALKQEHKSCNVSKKKISKPSSDASRQARTVYQLLSQRGLCTFNLNASFDSQENRVVVEKVLHEAASYYQEQAPNQSEITESLKTYLRSMKEEKNRQDKGTAEKHKQANKCRNRKKRKLQMRQHACQQMEKWTGEQRTRIQEVLKLDYMSSDEECPGSPRKLRKVLPWQSAELRLRMKELDVKYEEQLKDRRAKNALTVYKGIGSVSLRPRPKDAPLWAVKSIC